jgi:hypothetical protein
MKVLAWPLALEDRTKGLAAKFCPGRCRFFFVFQMP